MVQDLVRKLTDGKEPNKGVKPRRSRCSWSSHSGWRAGRRSERYPPARRDPALIGRGTMGSVMTKMIERQYHHPGA